MEPTHVNLTTAREWMLWLKETGVLTEPTATIALSELQDAIKASE